MQSIMTMEDISSNQPIYSKYLNGTIKKEESKGSLGWLLDDVTLNTPLQGQGWNAFTLFSEVTAARDALRKKQNFRQMFLVLKESTMHSRIGVGCGMEIFVKTLSGRTSFTLQVKSSDAVHSVKEKIQEKVGIPPDYLSLTFAGELLIASRTLDYYGIHDKSTLMLIRHGAKISVNIKQVKRFDFEFEISDTTVDSIKEKIHAEARIPPHQQKLFYDDELLMGDRTLAGECVGGGETTMHEYLRCLGDSHICVKFMEVRTFTFYDSDSIVNVKAKIQDVVGVPHDQQTLIYEGQLLEGGTRTLAGYKIRMDSTLDLIDGNMKIYVKTLTGKVFPLYVESSKTIYDVMEKISVREGIPSSMQRLFFKGQRLMYGRTLASYNIPDESTLNLALNFRGGDDGITITIEPLLGKTLILRIEAASNPVTEIPLPSPTLPTSGVDISWLEYLLSFLITIKGYSEKWGLRLSWVLFSRTRTR